MRHLWLAAVVLAACKATGPVEPAPPTDPIDPEIDPIEPVEPVEPEIARLRGALRVSERAREELALELMIVRFGQGASSFRDLALSDREFVERALVKWEAVQAPLASLTSEQRRILDLLPGAVRRRYNHVPIPKEGRFEASRALVAGLMSKHDTIRRVATNALDLVYGRTLGYAYNAPEELRAAKYKEWVSVIHRLRR